MIPRPLRSRCSNRQYLAVLLVAVLPLGSFWNRPTQAEPVRAESVQSEVVLLHSGAVLWGKTHTEGDRLVISGIGSELRIPVASVAARRSTLGQLYGWRREQLSRGAAGVGAHLALAEWCLRHELWAEASRELLDARQLAPESRRVVQLERRLMLLSRQPAAVEPSLTAVELVQPTEPVASNEVPAALPILPEGDFEQFARRIQPLLVNNCTDGGCHREACSMALDVSLRHGYADARSTEHNLREVFAAIDKNDPSASPLIVAARGPHAGGSPFSGPRREEWLERLEAWVTEVAAANRTEDSATLATDDESPANSSIQLATHEMPLQEEGETFAPLASRPLAIGGTLRAVAPRDEFDPELFNRKFRRPEDDLAPAESRVAQ